LTAREGTGIAAAVSAHAEVRAYEAGRLSWATCLNPLSFLASLVRHRELLLNLIRRNVAARYRGSFLGIGWTVLQPLLMLAVYTYVFGVVFQTRWRPESAGHGEFALALFCGLIPFGFLAECASAAPSAVIANANYVKRVVFPLELLPVVTVGSAFVVAAMNTLVLVGATFVVLGVPPPTVLLLPVAAVPCVLLGLALAWLLAMLGVFVRDTASIVAFLTQVVFFMTPIVYPPSAVPERFRDLVYLNPLAVLVELWRALALGIVAAPWFEAGILTAVAAVLGLVGRAVFIRAQRAFADVL
jgi:lipopolysaccharide transport system permease protein